MEKRRKYTKKKKKLKEKSDKNSPEGKKKHSMEEGLIWSVFSVLANKLFQQIKKKIDFSFLHFKEKKRENYWISDFKFYFNFTQIKN